MTLHSDRSDAKKRTILAHFKDQDYFNRDDVVDFLQCSSSNAIQYLLEMEDARMITGEQYAGKKRYCARKYFLARKPWTKTDNGIRIGLHNL